MLNQNYINKAENATSIIMNSIIFYCKYKINCTFYEIYNFGSQFIYLYFVYTPLFNHYG